MDTIYEHKYWRWGWLIGGLLCVLWFLWFYGTATWTLVQDQEALKSIVTSLGWFGPIVLILLNGLQIIIAPIPGLAFPIVAGFLYGPWWGGLWATIGQLIGAMVAMWLARTYGRPLTERLVGSSRMARWEEFSLSTHTLVWCILLTAPTGDLPYFLAGLSTISYTKIIIITLVIRVPATFVVAAAGAGVPWLSWQQIGVATALLVALLLLFWRYQEPLLAWIDGRAQDLSARSD